MDRRVEFFRREAGESVLAGADPERVRERLVENGFSEFEAKEIVSVAASSLRTEKRGYGFFRIVVGIPVALFGLVPTVVGAVPAFHGRGPNLILLLGGGTIFIVGVWAVLSGIYALIMGKEVDG